MLLESINCFHRVAPPAARWQPSKMRWSVCSEEYCFVTPAMQTFFSCGNGIPIQRGASIYQQGMSKLAGKLDEGYWVHLFPEGRIWQETGHPPRDSQGRWCSSSGRCEAAHKSKELKHLEMLLLLCKLLYLYFIINLFATNTGLGPMKWGVGKLIANADVTPVVVPFFHMGMDELAPQNKHNNIVKGETMTDPKGFPGSMFKGSKVIIKIGNPVDCVDLIRDYHVKAIERAKRRHHKKHSKQGSVNEGTDWALSHQMQRPESEADLPIARSQGPDVRAWLQKTYPASETVREGHNFPHRRTSDGRRVPAHREPLLRIKPPDHESLTPEEAAEEEQHRLKLYQDISERLASALRKLESEVREIKKNREEADKKDAHQNKDSESNGMP